jgi:hypothetical protein
LVGGMWLYTAFPSTGRISPTATLLQNGNVLVTGGNSEVGNSAEIFNSATTCSPIIIQAGTLPNTTAGAAYDQSLSQTGIIVTPVWSINAGALPDGLNLHTGSGKITGSPRTVGTYNFTVRVTGGNCFGEQNYSIVVSKGTTFTSVSPRATAVGQTITYEAKITSSSVLTNATGTVQFKLDSVSIGSPVSVVNGVASLSQSAPAIGSYVVTAFYSGDSNYLASDGSMKGGLYSFQYSVQDDVTHDSVLFNATAGVIGRYFSSHCATPFTFLNNPATPTSTSYGTGSIVISGRDGSINLTVVASNGNSVVKILRNVGTGTSTIAGVTRTFLRDTDVTNNTAPCF